MILTRAVRSGSRSVRWCVSRRLPDMSSMQCLWISIGEILKITIVVERLFHVGRDK